MSIHPGDNHDTVGEVVHTYPGCIRFVFSFLSLFLLYFLCSGFCVLGLVHRLFPLPLMIMLPFPCVVPLLVICFYLLSVLLLLFMLFFCAILVQQQQDSGKVYLHLLCLLFLTAFLHPCLWLSWQTLITQELSFT